MMISPSELRGINTADVLRVFPGARFVATNKPLSCEHCQGVSVPHWRRGGKVAERIDADGSHVWACHFCGRRLQEIEAPTITAPADDEISPITEQAEQIATRARLEKMFDEFFVPLFGKARGNIELRCFPSRHQFFSGDKNEIISFIDAHIGENVFFGCATRRDNDGSKPGTLEVPFLWADVDFKDFAGGETEAREVIAAFAMTPSIVVQSGHGLHLYFLLGNPMPAGLPEGLEVEKHLKGIAKALRADPAAAELARVLRVPGTYNHKNGDKVLVILEGAA
jgi:hypothetical protein